MCLAPCTVCKWPRQQMCFSFPRVHSYVTVIQFDAHLIFFLAGFISPRIHNENSNEAFARAAEKFISNITASGCNSYCSAAGKHVSGVVLLFQSFNTRWLILISGVPFGAWACTQVINYSVVILSKRKKAKLLLIFLLLMVDQFFKLPTSTNIWSVMGSTFRHWSLILRLVHLFVVGCLC